MGTGCNRVIGDKGMKSGSLCMLWPRQEDGVECEVIISRELPWWEKIRTAASCLFAAGGCQQECESGDILYLPNDLACVCGLLFLREREFERIISIPFTPIFSLRFLYHWMNADETEAIESSFFERMRRRKAFALSIRSEIEWKNNETVVCIYQQEAVDLATG